MSEQMMIKLLIIEDEIRLSEILYDWFCNRDFQVTVCHDGISGYESALKVSYDAIISDVMLPDMDGFTIVKKLRSMKVRTPVIMLTARVELQDKLQGFEAGAEDYLTKPFEYRRTGCPYKSSAQKKWENSQNRINKMSERSGFYSGKKQPHAKQSYQQ